MLALLTAVSRPSVHVDADAAGNELQGWLMVRLSEEGFELVPDAAQAEVDLHVQRDGEGWVVEAQADDRQAYRVAEGPATLQRLEVLHRAVAAALEVTPREVPESPSSAVARVAIEIDPAADREARDRLTAQVTLAVLAAGARVATPGGPHDRRVCARDDDAGVLLGTGESSCAAAEVVAIAEAPQWIARAVSTEPEPAATAEPEPTATAEPEPAASVEPVVSREPAATPGDRREDTPTETDARRTSSSETERAARRRLVLRVGARGGLVARTRPVDGAISADVRIGRFAGPSAWIDLQVWPSFAAGGRLRIVETVPAVGLRWRFVVHDRVALDAGALLGVAIHAYGLQRDRGAAADVSGEVAGALGVRLAASLQLEVEVRGGLVGRDRTHEIAGAPVWERDAWRGSAFAGLSWGFDLRGRR